MSVKCASPSLGARATLPPRRGLLLALSWFVLLVPTMVRAECTDYEGSFRFLGSSNLPDYGKDVAVEGALAYVASGVPCESCTGRLDVFDVSTVGQPGGGPSIMAGVELAGGPVALAVLGERAYVGVLGGWLQVVDVSNPSDPTLMTTLPAEGINDLAVTSGRLFAATDSGLQIYDLSDPDSPVEVGSCSFAGPARSVALSAALAFVVWGGFGSGGSGLSVVNVAAPANPIVLSSIWSNGVASVVSVSGTRAYLGGGFRYRDMDGFLDVIDVSDPLRPILEASLGDLTFPVQGVAIKGTAVYATAADPWYFYGSFYVIDVSDPETPILVRAEDLEFQALGPCIAAGIVYFCEDRLTGGLHYATAPSDVRPKALCTVASSVDTYSVDAQADLVYVTDPGLFKVMDFSDPVHPQVLGSLATPARGEVVEVQGDFAYIGYLMRSSNVIDVSNVYHPQTVATISQALGVLDMVASGTWLYTTGWNGLWTIDISNPPSPVARGHLTLGGHAIAVDGSHAYILDGSRFNVVDVGNPAIPVLVGTLGTQSARALAVSGSHAFVVDSRGVQIIDVVDPAFPVEVGRIEGIEDLNAAGIWIQGDYAYLAGDRMVVADIRDPIHPMLLGETESQVNAWPRDIVGSEQCVLIAGENLRVFPLQCSRSDGKAIHQLDPAAVVRVAPNPMRDEIRLELRLDPAPARGERIPVRVRVVDLAGRIVAKLADEQLDAGTHVLRWDGRRDCDGRPAPAGVYWLRIDGAGMEPRTARIVKLPGE